MNRYLKQPKGCSSCGDRYACPDAFSEKSQFCGSYDHEETGPGASIFGKCQCGAELEAVWFTEEEIDSHSGLRTGRIRRAVDYLVCPNCDIRYQVDSCFDSPWRYPNNH